MSTTNVGDVVYWKDPTHGKIMSGKLLSTTGQGTHATAKVQLPHDGGTVNVRLIRIKPSAIAAQQK